MQENNAPIRRCKKMNRNYFWPATLAKAKDQGILTATAIIKKYKIIQYNNTKINATSCSCIVHSLQTETILHTPAGNHHRTEKQTRYILNMLQIPRFIEIGSPGDKSKILNETPAIQATT